jgi:NAD(P)H dehydrogenase (quinone)
VAANIVVTGASGKLGRLSAERALELIGPERVVLTTRTPEVLADLAERGASVRHADFDRPETLAPAFAGADRMLFISATNATGLRMDQHGAAIAGAREAGVERIVFTSMPRVEDVDHPTGLLAEEYRDSEALLRESGVPWTIVRNAPYTELHIVERMAEMIAAGEIVSNATSGGVSWISRRDCAAAAVGALLADDQDGVIHVATGPAAVPYEELAATLTEVLGRPIVFRPISDDEMTSKLDNEGIPEMFAKMFAGFGIAVRRGDYGDLTDAVKKLAGAPPEPLLDVLTRERDQLGVMS